MNLKKMFKISMCTICLGLTIASSIVLAREETRREIKELEDIPNYHDDYYNSYYNCHYDEMISMGMDKEEVKKLIEIHSKLITEEKKDYDYANYCFELMLEGEKEKEARMRSDLYFKLIESGKNSYYANYYIESIFIGIKHEDAVKRARMYSNLLLKNQSENYAECYVDLVVRGKMNHKEADRISKIYSRLIIEEGKRKVYAIYYIRLLLEGSTEEVAKMQAKIYEKEIISGKDEIKADRIARKEVYKREIEKKIYEDKKKKESEIYARYYSKVKANQI